MKRTNHRQQGLSLLTFLFALGFIGFFVIIGMKIVPMYTEYYSVTQVLEELETAPGLSGQSNYAIKSSLFKRLQVNYVRSVKGENIRIIRKDGVRVRITYEIRKSLIGNLDVVGTFDREVRLRG